jgi:cytochrome c biogenesis protein CcmG/thiol:disulfide interchange protein DsbE
MGFSRRRALMLLPLGAAGAVGFAFWKMLDRMEQGKFDPHALDNPLVGKSVPAFSLPGVGTAKGFSTADLKAAAVVRPVLVNFFWSSCIPCAEESDTLAALANDGVPIWGFAWKDKAPEVGKFLDRYGNPYARIADDATGRVSIDWGVYGFPESFLIDRAGIVRWHYAGPLADGPVMDDLRAALKAVA